MTPVSLRVDADGIAYVVVDRPDDSVNAINLEFIEALAQAIHGAREKDPKGLIVVSNKQGQWVAGADLKLIGEAPSRKAIEAASRRLQAVFDELAWLPFTTVAAINGSALGGGLELALACDYRVSTDEPSVLLGQPEVNLGLVPAGGGTQRLPRLIGLERALDLILTGRRLNARRARRAGLLDEVVHPAVLDQAARAWVRKPKRPLGRKSHFGFDQRALVDLAEQTPLGRQFIYRQARKAVMERTHGQYPAPLKALEAVKVGFEHGTAAGLDAESLAFGELATSETSKNLTWLFTATQRARRNTGAFEHIGVVGAGFMGAAIAEVAAVAGLSVRLKDVSDDAVARGLARIRWMTERLQPRERQAALSLVSGTTDYTGFAGTEVVIEAVFEDLSLKRQVLSQLEDVVPAETVIASNTSALPIREVAAQAQHPERVVGMHFFSPAERMPLLEVIRPDAATERAIDTAVALGSKLGKTTIVVADSPGFYTTRVLGVMLNEAALLLNEGARIDEVDRAMTHFGFPVGPFVLYDEVGLEVAQHAGETVARAFGDRIPISSAVSDLLAHGATGRKSGRGFLLWPHARKLPLRADRWTPNPQPVANPLVYGAIPRRELSHEYIRDRLVLLFVNEAIRCLEEGVIQSPIDGDLGAVLGLGFPPFRGGPFHYADSLGADALCARLKALAREHGERYAPTQSIQNGTRFYEEHHADES